MSKYIDAEKLKAEIERRKYEWQAILDKNNAVNPEVIKQIIFEEENILDVIDSLQQEQPTKGYDEAYLNECIAKASKTWEGVDADKYLDEVRGREQEQPQVADDSKMEQSEGYLEYWLEQFGMPKENIENCATQIAQGYGACRYLEGVQHGAEAVSELAEQESEFPVTDGEMEAFLASHPKVEVPEKYKTPDWLYKELEQEPEVELEKEINHFWDSCIKHKNERGGNVIWSNKIEIEALARHFYELGLKARKEGQK